MAGVQPDRQLVPEGALLRLAVDFQVELGLRDIADFLPAAAGLSAFGKDESGVAELTDMPGNNCRTDAEEF